MHRKYRLISTLSLLLAVACGEEARSNLPTDADADPATGYVNVSVSTTGPDTDPDGFRVFLDGEPRALIGTSGTMTLRDVTIGEHRVELGDLDGCFGGTSKTVRIVPNRAVDVSFSVECDDWFLATRP